MAKIKGNDKIGLALGGGAVLGAAHIGVLKALDESGIEICAISGTSIGALFAALYAFGKSPDEIEKFIEDLHWLDVSGLSLSKFGLLSNEKLGEAFEDAVGDVEFSDAKIPLAVIATDIGNGKKVTFRKGSVAPAIMASSCVPGIVTPVEIDDRLLVDGGLVENVPVSPLEDLGAKKIIGVDLNAKRTYQSPDDIIDLLANALDVAIDNATRIQTDEADLLITPELTAYSRTDRDRIPELIKEGYDAAKKILRDKIG